MNKKSQAEVVSVIMILFVVIAALLALGNWYFSFNDSMKVKGQLREDGSKVEVIGLKQYGNWSYIAVRNLGNSYHIVESVTLNNNDCTLLSTNVIDSLDNIQTNCYVQVGLSYSVEVQTDKGFYYKTLTANDN